MGHACSFLRNYISDGLLAAKPSAEAARTGLLGAVLVVWNRFFTRPEPAWA